MKVDEDQNQDMRDAIRLLKARVKARRLKSRHTKVTKENAGRKDAREDDNDSADDDSADGGDGGAGGGDHAQLRAQGYEVKSDVIVDDKGIEIEPIFKRPDHILTVYRLKDPEKKFIAKKVREESDEIEILTLFKDVKLESNHVIPLIESFDGWVILPKMITVQGYVEISPKRLEKVCLGLIEGVAYLHVCSVAHRDIKPDNLVVDRDFRLKIIDLDAAMRVKDEDEEVDDQCGTKHWMAPEVVLNKRHSPIRADRWACGRVLLYLLNRFGKGDERLKAFATNLSGYDPKERPSLLEWHSNSCSADSKKASKHRQDLMKIDEVSNAKKPRLGGSE
ncbi:kinase-like domain-containing protein [Russula brevipes]|nr:kinase-like domain-containing protein [Russula brevipes]